ncbi:MAG: RnfABCDGE type electron transport complex subunit G [Bacteroidales bacterium]|nr:RnfABCDGE type electron transport complex subunit G [Bacteroidales bacterium]
MAKKESTFLNMLVTLLLVTLASSAALGYIYEFTKGPIAIAKSAKKNMAIHKVVPEFTNLPGEEVKKVVADNDTLYLYPAKNGDQLVGVAVETFTNKGFGGPIRLMVGFLPDGTINDIAVLEHKETPGLGDKMQKSKSNFSLQFEGKNPDNFKLSVKKDGGDVDAITASTISSRAFCDAVQRAYTVFKEGGIQ